MNPHVPSIDRAPSRALWSIRGPLLGDARFGQDPLAFLDRARREYGPRVWFRLGPLRVLLWTEAEATDEILRRQASAFEKPALLSRFGAPLFGQALTTQDGARWQARRGELTRALRSLDAARLRQIEDLVLEELRAPPVGDGVLWLQRGLTAGLVRGLLGAPSPVDLDRYCRAIADSVERVGDHMSDGIPWPGWWPWGRVKELARLRSIQLAHVGRWLQGADLSQPLCRALLESEPYREAGPSVVHDELNVALGLGAHQAALALAFTLLEVLPRPDCAERVGHDRASANRAVREALRLHPPFYALVRRAVRDVRVQDLLVKRGTIVMLSPWLLHRDSALHPEPSAFRLERTEGPPGSYLPYGLGSRACPARSMLLATLGGILSGLLRSHALRLTPGYEPEHTAKLGLGLAAPLPLLTGLPDVARAATCAPRPQTPERVYA